MHTLPRNDGTVLNLTLSLPSTDPDQIAMVEQAAALSGMLISRIDDE